MAFRNALSTTRLKRFVQAGCRIDPEFFQFACVNCGIEAPAHWNGMDRCKKCQTKKFLGGEILAERGPELRDSILVEAQKLIDAALYSKGLFNLPFQNHQDLKQECSLKLLTALEKFNPEIISETTHEAITAFPFFWTVICNAIRSQGKAIAPRKENVELEADSIFEEVSNFMAPDTPERSATQHSIQFAVADALQMAARTNGNVVIEREIMNGRIFTDRTGVIEFLTRKKKKSKQRAEEIVTEAVVCVRSALYDHRQSVALLHPRQFRSCRGVPELDD